MSSINAIPPLNPVQAANPLQLNSSAGNVSLDDYIKCIKQTEEKYPKAPTADVLSALRLLYYSGEVFYQLIPDSFGLDGGSYPFPVLLEKPCIECLKRRADENGRGDNPSPYLMVDNRGKPELIDAGHLLLACDALLHPKTKEPYSNYAIPNEDISGWPADISIAAYWNEVYPTVNKTDFKKARFINEPLKAKIDASSSLDINDFYNWSAPESDLLGDVDGYILKNILDKTSGIKLSDAFLSLYKTGATPFFRNRYYLFCFKNAFNYNYEKQDWVDVRSIYGKWLPRIDRTIDLFMDGNWSIISETAKQGSWAWPAQTRKNYASSEVVFDKFLDWLKKKLQDEIVQRKKEGALLPDSGNMF